MGQTGSTNVADFVYKQYYTFGKLYGGQSSIILNGTLPNQGIGWEKTTEFNAGLDFGFFDNRLYGSIDWYYRYTNGALAPAPHILEAGMPNYSANIIDMTNRGVEFSLGADIVRTKDFNWSTLLNLSLNRNRIEKLNSAQIDVYMQDAFIVGKPMAQLMMQKQYGDSTVTVCHSRSKTLKEECREADIIIAAIGQPDFVTADMVKEGAVVIDVGTTRVPDASRKSGFRLNGDVKFDEVAPKCSFITPVPGGVGPMTICSLMKNTLAAGKKEYYRQ